MFAKHQSGLTAKSPDGNALVPPVASSELFGAVQVLFSMVQSDTRSVIVQVAGPTGREGASVVASSLARILNEETRLGVLLISFDNKDDRSSMLDIEHVSKGAASGRAAASDGGDLEIGVVYGQLPDRSRRHAMAGRLREELEGLPPEIGLIIVDTGPILTSLESCAISRQVDGVLLVIEAERTTLPEAENARTAIEHAGGRILGVVLNRRRFRIPGFLARILGLATRGDVSPSARRQPGEANWNPTQMLERLHQGVDANK